MLGFSNNQQNIQDRNNIQTVSMLPVPMNQPMQRNTMNVQRTGPVANNMNMMLNPGGAGNPNPISNTNSNTVGMGNAISTNSNRPSSLEMNHMSGAVGHPNQAVGGDGSLYTMIPYQGSMMTNTNNYYPFAMGNYSIYQQPLSGPNQSLGGAPPSQSQSQSQAQAQLQPPAPLSQPQSSQGPQGPQGPQGLPQQNQPYYVPPQNQNMSVPSQIPSQSQSQTLSQAPSKAQTPSQNTSSQSQLHPNSMMRSGASSQMPPTQLSSQGLHPQPPQPNQAQLSSQILQPQPPYYSNAASSSFLMDMQGGHAFSNGMNSANGGFAPGGNTGGSNAFNTFNSNIPSMNYSSNGGYSPFNTTLYFNNNGNGGGMGYNNGASNSTIFNTNVNPSFNTSAYNMNMNGSLNNVNNSSAYNTNVNGSLNSSSTYNTNVNGSLNNSSAYNTNVNGSLNNSSAYNTNVNSSLNTSNNSSAFNTNVNTSLNNSNNSSVVSTPNPYNTNNMNNNNNTTTGATATATMTSNTSPMNAMNQNANTGNFNAHGFNNGGPGTSSNNPNSTHGSFVGSLCSPLNPNAAVFTSVHAQNPLESGDPTIESKENSKKTTTVTTSESPAIATTDTTTTTTQGNTNKNSGEEVEKTNPETKEVGKGNASSGVEFIDTNKENSSSQGNVNTVHESSIESSTIDHSPSFLSSALNASSNSYIGGSSSYGGLTTSTNVVGSNQGLNSHSSGGTPFANNYTLNMNGHNNGNIGGNYEHGNVPSNGNGNIGGNYEHGNVSSNGNGNGPRGSISSVGSTYSNLMGMNGNRYNSGGMMTMTMMGPNGGNGMMNGHPLMGPSAVFSTNTNWSAGIEGTTNRVGGLPSMTGGSTGLEGTNRVGGLPSMTGHSAGIEGSNRIGGLPSMTGNNGNTNGSSNGNGGQGINSMTNSNMKLMMNTNGLGGGNMNAFSMSNGPNGLGSWNWNSGYTYNGFYDPSNSIAKFNGGSGDLYHDSDGRSNLKNGQPNNNNNGNGSNSSSSNNNNLNLISNLGSMNLSSGVASINMLNGGNGSGLLSQSNAAVGKGRMNNGLGISTGTPMAFNTPNLGPPGSHSGKSQDFSNDAVLGKNKSEEASIENGHDTNKEGSRSGMVTPSTLTHQSSMNFTGGSHLLSKTSKEELVASLNNSKEFVPGLNSFGSKEMSSLNSSKEFVPGLNSFGSKEMGSLNGSKEFVPGLNGLGNKEFIPGFNNLTKEMANLKLNREKLFSSNSSSLKPSPNITGPVHEKRMSFGGAFNPSNSNSSINTLVNYNMMANMGSSSNLTGNNALSNPNLSSSTEVVLKKKKSTSLIPFITRPGFGQAGRKIKLKANFYAIQNLPIENVHQYEFVIVQKSPRKDTNISPELLRLLYQRWWEIFKKENHKPLYPVFDGRHYIFSATLLPFPNDKAVYTINLVRDGNVSSERVFEITLRKVQEISMKGLHQFLEGKNLEVPTEALQVIDTIFRHFPSFLDNQFSIVGRSFFTNDDIEEISNGVQLWRGHHQSLKASRDRLLINIDISATAFYKPGSLKDVIQNYFGKDDLKILLNDTERQHIESFLKGIKIKINYRDNSRRTYKILRFSNVPANQQMITNIQTKNEQSVTDYFKETYGITLKYPHIPCIDVGKVSQPIYIPVELCEVPDGQKYLKKLNEKQTTEMIKFTCQLPNLREGKINSGRQRLQPDNNEYFNSLNVNISEKMEIVDARILPAPTIVFNKESQEPKIRPNGGIWSLKNKKLALGSTLSSWSILAFGKETDYPRETINNFLVELVKTLKENGVNVRNANPPIVYGNKNEIEESLYRAYHEACGCDIKMMKEDEDGLTSISPGINRKLILCILPSRVNNTTPYYAEIKRIADTVIGVVTQCIQGRHITAPIKSYCGNLSLKINVKLGGYNNFILPEQIRFIMEEPTIVFGGNVTNPGPGDRIHPSIVALVGSMDCQCSHYIATTRIQERKKECIIKLSEMIVILFKKFYKINELKPKRILFYRDSISESQYQSVMQYELNEIWEACRMMEEGYRPTITYIVVQKRHHARFFPVRKEESDSKGNILAGTVIESSITHPSQFDFYLCSHPGLQGTSRPTHYHVLYDEHHFTADELEELTYHMCFLYSRSTRAVSIVPPAYYAHLAAARVKYHAHEAWNEQEQQQQQSQQSSQQQQQQSSLTYGVNGSATSNDNRGSGTNTNSPALASSSDSLEGSQSGSNSTLASSVSSPTIEKSNATGNQTLNSSPSSSSLKANQPVRRVLYEPVKEELQEIMYFM